MSGGQATAAGRTGGCAEGRKGPPGHQLPLGQSMHVCVPLTAYLPRGQAAVKPKGSTTRQQQAQSPAVIGWDVPRSQRSCRSRAASGTPGHRHTHSTLQWPCRLEVPLHTAGIGGLPEWSLGRMHQPCSHPDCKGSYHSGGGGGSSQASAGNVERCSC